MAIAAIIDIQPIMARANSIFSTLSLPWAKPQAVPTVAQGSPMLQVRAGKRADRDAVRRMEVACFGWLRNLFGLSPKVGTSDTRVWIAEVDGARAGYVIAYLKPLQGTSTLYVGGVGTLPQFRQRGVAEAMMREVFAVDPNVWLHVRASNTAAIRLYEKLGMAIIERLPRFYSNGEDALVMASGDVIPKASRS